ncbi:MAG: CHAT domain-containing protein [Microcoleus sp. PH2017_10_PVI_O_A]|uniref:CHAT domain-containing protein n=1 Tax=unclassified Microcoleus TaxID=2642155 RepID=UPI001D4B2819|nr:MULTISPECIES: CHAT domain-containing tetratricopeptide repeat protein [unclassified Microcoleus]TAE83744.1 MAG: CHAT domain-containing protein [Oscillatoriales cyanobacterium]MCC3405941.1 CHAT domain-containing protein [Microcoleus sp. PH2017_10_PVI_O_A]MCC3459968.1 CHAT domain-containing protein [Microcoleus sp. PH2017_11_PCY_U_A]MCC3478482.1 CHAT domain-containing protein [Microcoleus sp. PH2017_12_PCY_D_A]MCC3527942.1 CHAT domain-containing protein [Microcoleus sp. PH2017_21_RUC_O_A]
MDDNRMNAYLQLIKKMRECTSGKEEQILKEYSELVEPELLATIIALIKESDDNGDQNEANCLKNLVLQVIGEFIGSDRQSNEIRKKAANIVFKWGEKQFHSQKFTIASDCWQNCLIIYKAIYDCEGEASCLVNLGHASYSQNSNKEALGYYLKSLRICRKIKNSKKEAVAFQSLWNPYNSLGIAYLLHGEYKKAIKYHKKSLKISHKISDRKGKANSLGNLGCAYNCLGQYEVAIDYHKQQFEISREINDARGQANSLGNLGNAYDSLEEYEKAIDCHQRQFEISKEINDLGGQANSLGNLGNAYNSLRQYEQAIDYYKKSLDITHKIKDRRGEAACLGNLGLAYKFLEQYEQAIHYYEKCLDISQKIKDSRGEVAALGNLGLAYQLWDQTDRAIKNFCDCLKIATPETMPVECFTTGRSLGHIGIIKGDWKLALKGYESAMQAVENLRQGATTDKRRQKIIKEAISVYTNTLQCYINLEQYDKAVETAERSRSRHLADLFFASKDLYPKSEITPEVEEYYDLQQQIYRLRFSENESVKALAATPQPTPNGDAILQNIQELEAEQQKTWLKIRTKDQVLAGQLQPELLTFKNMQELIPDTETAILNFYTTDKHTHIFILRPNQPLQLHTCEGQGLKKLQNWLLNNWLTPYYHLQKMAALVAAKLLKIKLNDLESINIKAENITVKLAGGSERKLDRQQFDIESNQMKLKIKNVWLKRISMVLPKLANRLQLKKLIESHLKDIKELIVIPHLSLHQIPFAALPLNNISIPHIETASDKTRGSSLDMSEITDTPAKTPPQQPEYLSDRFRIRIVPSCQILNFCHQRGNLKPAKMGIVENATGDLVFTGYECETLATMHQVDKNHRLQYQQATISNYQNLLDRVQGIHSSHHASSDLNNSLESKLLLFDGNINLGRIFTWRFSYLAEVFLSCCETNLTLTEITDDPLSIATGFLCAGARNVVSTLWAVDDLATALFCILYYQEKQDKSRSEAMRQAQFKLRNLTGDELSAKYKRQLEYYFDRQPSGEQQAEIVKNVRVRLDLLCRETLPFVSPHYWAGFVSQGLA